MNDVENARVSRLAWAVLIAGAATSHMASGYLYDELLGGGWAKWLGSSAALVIGLTVTGWMYWSLSRPFAGGHYRVEVVAVLAVSAFMYRNWIRLAGFDGWSIAIADFAMSLAAFSLGLLVYKCLAPIDQREATRNTAAAK